MTQRTRLDPSRRGSPCLSVLEAVAERDGVAVSSLDPPLYETIDPDALEAVLDTKGTASGTPVTVRFEYAGYHIVVGSDGSVAIE